VAGAGVAWRVVTGAGVVALVWLVLVNLVVVMKRKKRTPTARNELVRKVMKEQNLSLPAASSYIKKNGLQYK
jgi:hypothetical protein